MVEKMINIIDNKKTGFYKFKCEKCQCEFEADHDEYRQLQNGGYGTILRTKCPRCKSDTSRTLRGF